MDFLDSLVWYGSGRLQKVFWVGGTKQLQCLLRSRPPESEIEIELERTWEASRVDLEIVWPLILTLFLCVSRDELIPSI